MPGVAFHGHGTTAYDSVSKKYVGSWSDSMSTGLAISEGTFDPATKKITGTMSARDMTGAMAKSRTVSESPGCRSSRDDDVRDHARRQGDADDAHLLYATEVTPASRRLHVSTENSAFQVLESLVSNRVKRHRSRTFVLEGVQPITRALAHGWTFEAVIHESGASLSDWAADVIARAGAAVRYEMTPELLGETQREDRHVGVAGRRADA